MRVTCLIVSTAVLAGCGGTSTAPQPTPASYGPKFQDKLAEEQRGLKDPCPRRNPQDDCSALHRQLIDHYTLREKLRAVQGGT